MKEKRCQGTSISFNEPTLLFEYSLDVFDLAKKEGFYNIHEKLLRDLTQAVDGIGTLHA